LVYCFQSGEVSIEGEDCIDRGKGEMWCPPPIIGVSDTTPREKKSLGRHQRVKKVYNLKVYLGKFNLRLETWGN
jgi:hypothetical protein